VFEKKVIGPKMCVLNSSTNFDENICHYTKQRTRYDQKYLTIFMKSARYSCLILMKLQFSTFFFRKYPNKNSQEIQSSVRRVVPCRQTERHDEVNSRFSQFCERA